MVFHLYGTEYYPLKHFPKMSDWLPRLFALLWKHPPRCSSTAICPVYAQVWGFNLFWW